MISAPLNHRPIHRFLRAAANGCLLALLLALAPAIYAQSTFGTINGTVSDPTGAVVPNATVTLTNKNRQISRTATTNGEGSYLVTSLDPGIYAVEVSVTGFGKATRTLELLARQIARVDIRLEPATTTERVDIVATSPITVESPTISDSKSGREINELALNFRATSNPSPIVVATMAPGVQQDRGGSISVAGNQPFMTSFSIDGISSQSVRGGGAVRDLFPSVEGIAEFRVSSTNNNAEFGQASDVTTISKSGNNDYHGSGFWFHQNSVLNATNPFGPRGADGRRLRPPTRANSFGGSFGGPVSIPKIYDARNRTFFFFDYEGVRRPDQVLLSQFVPPDAFRRGDLSSITTALRNPFTGGTYANNQIPVNPAAAKALELLWERQNQNTGAAIDRPNYIVNASSRYQVNGFDLRGDHNFNDQHKTYVRYTHKNVSTQGPTNNNYNTKFGEYLTSPRVRNMAGSYTWIVRPDLINEFRAGYTINNTVFDYPFAKQGAQITQAIGLTGLPKPPELGGTPNFNFTDGSFIASNNVSRPHVTENKTIQFNDNMTWTRGRHTFKGGFDFQRLKFRDYLSFFSGDDFGEYAFTGAITGNAFADFLIGVPSVTTYAANGPDVRPFANHYAMYFQDDFRVSSKLTLNYGVRYELHPPFSDVTNQLTNFDRFTKGGRVVVQNEEGLRIASPLFRADIGNTPILTAAAAGLPKGLRATDKNDWNPRLGFAWRPFGDNKTVIRGGAGVYTVTVLGSVLYSLAGIATSNAPVYQNAAVAGGYRIVLPNAFPSSGVTGSGGIPDFRRANQTDLRDPYSYQWNLTIEREMWWNTGLRLTYTGTRTHQLVHSPDLNQVRPNTTGYTDAVRASRPFPNFNAVLTRDNGTGAKYHAFTAEFTRRFSNGLSFQNSYTLAKNLSNAGGPAPGGFAAENGPTTLNIYGMQADYGNVAFTRRHRMLSTFLWELPFGRGRKMLNGINGYADQVIGGWQINGILLFQSGPFLTPTFTGTDPSGTGVLVRGVTTTQRPDRIGDGNIDNPTIDAYFDRNAFVRPANNIGRFGNAGVGILRGPGTEVFSMTLGKQFSLTEKLKLRYEAAFSNLFNHLNPDTPGTLNITSAAFGRITNVQMVDQAGPRVIQMSLRLAF
ncbi:MAG: carboxypeptidase regulatory-like domain-containing protein [Blastocatellia bacterium]